ncbi:MAG TPA: DUF2946 family protein [Steroidobacter sp.]|nr:DUF2946 family protein [Steroidobacter sp.]
MDDWVLRAIERWPNIPALAGWLGLDRRGRWLIRGEPIRHSRIIETINRNYGCDAHGRWFFQNGPQRGYITLASAPFVLRRTEDSETLVTHTNLPVRRAQGAFLDEEGSLVLAIEQGAGEIAGDELEWVLRGLQRSGRNVRDEELADALAAPSGEITALTLHICGVELPIIRLDFADAPVRLNFVRNPQPLEGERAASGAPD